MAIPDSLPVRRPGQWQRQTTHFTFGLMTVFWSIMKKPSFFLKPLTATLVACAIASCAPSGPSVATSSVPVSASDASAANALFDQVNSYRTSKGLAKIERHPGLDRLAQGHANFMRANRGKFGVDGRYVSHDGFEARSLIAEQKYGMPGAQENVGAATQGSSVFTAWKNSSIHEKVIRAKWTYTGMGVAVDKDGMVFATQIFGNPASSHLMLQQRFGAF